MKNLEMYLGLSLAAAATRNSEMQPQKRAPGLFIMAKRKIH